MTFRREKRQPEMHGFRSFRYCTRALWQPFGHLWRREAGISDATMKMKIPSETRRDPTRLFCDGLTRERTDVFAMAGEGELFVILYGTMSWAELWHEYTSRRRTTRTTGAAGKIVTAEVVNIVVVWKNDYTAVSTFGSTAIKKQIVGTSVFFFFLYNFDNER